MGLMYFVVRITLGAVSDQMVFDQDVMKRSRLIMDKSYSWPWAVPDVSAKKHQSQQGQGAVCRVAATKDAVGRRWQGLYRTRIAQSGNSNAQRAPSHVRLHALHQSRRYAVTFIEITPNIQNPARRGTHFRQQLFPSLSC